MFLFNNKDRKPNNEVSKRSILKSDGYFMLGRIANGSYGEVRHTKHI